MNKINREKQMSLTKYLTQKEIYSPIIDGAIGGFGDGIGELLYEWMWWHSYRWPTKKWEDLNPVAKALNWFDLRAGQLREHYYSLYYAVLKKERERLNNLHEADISADKSLEYKRLSNYWAPESFFKGITKLLLGPAFFLIGGEEYVRRTNKENKRN